LAEDIKTYAQDIVDKRRAAGALPRAIFINSTNFSSSATDAQGVMQVFLAGAERPRLFSTDSDRLARHH